MHATFPIRGYGLSRLPLFVFGLTAVVLSLCSPMKVAAQQADGEFEGERTWTDKAGDRHEVKPPNPKDSKIRTALGKMRTEGKASSDADEELFNNFAQNLVRQLTWKENVSRLPDERKELKKQLIQWGKAPAADLHKRLNELALQVCTEVAKDARYPRAVRINCVLMLSDLDEREHNAGAQQPAVPLPGATAALVELLADEKQPPFIRYVSIVALMRHVQPAMPAALQGQAAEALQKIMSTPVPDGKQLNWHVWSCVRASDVLLSMVEHKLPVDQAALAGSLAGLLADENLPFWPRSIYAGDLGKLDSKSLPPAEITATVRALDSLVLAILQSSPFMPGEAEAEEAEREAARPSREASGRTREAAGSNREPAAGTREAAAGNGQDGDDKKDDKKEEISPAAQKLLSEEMMWQLARIRRGLYGKEAPAARDDRPDAILGLHAAASDADKAAITKIVAQIDKCVKALTDVPDKLDKVAETLRDANQELEGLFAEAVEQPQTAMADKEGAAGKPAGKAAGSR